MKNPLSRLLLFLAIAPPTALAADPNPIPHFNEVEVGLTRGGTPGASGVLYLKGLGVKTILDLDDNAAAMKAEKVAAEEAGIRWISVPMSGFWSPRTASVDRALATVADSSLRPLFVHCKHGQDRTGLVVGLYRVEEERWQPGHAYDEMKSLGFHPTLVFLNHFFEKRTGFED